jgi:hypothetical protein
MWREDVVSNLIVNEQQFPPPVCECGDQFLVGVTVIPFRNTLAKQTGVYTPETRIDWQIIEATENGWQDANGHAWADWSPSDVTCWAKLPAKLKGLDVCEHGVQEGVYCEPCNKEYKRAAAEHEATENHNAGQIRDQDVS